MLPNDSSHLSPANMLNTIKITTSTRRKEIPPNTDRINFDLSLKGGGDSKKGVLKALGC